MTVNYPYTPFPFSVAPISPLFHLSPVSLNASLGWAPSCVTPECLPTASWSTSAANSTLSYQFWGWDVAFDGRVEGNMTVELFRNGIRTPWSPSGDTLFRLHGESTDHFYQQEVTLKVLEASPDAQLVLTQARVNGSSFADIYIDADRWTIGSDNNELNYTGFVPQTSATGSPSVHTSSRAGDMVSMRFNASAFLLYGPCGPTSGLMRVTLYNNQEIVNTSRPFASNDCLLYQTRGMPIQKAQEFVIENVDGGTLSISRFEFFRVLIYNDRSGIGAPIVAGVTLAVIGVCALIIVVYVRRAAKKREETDGRPVNPSLSRILC